MTFDDTLRDLSCPCTAVPYPQKKNQGEERLCSAALSSCSAFWVVFLECLVLNVRCLVVIFEGRRWLYTGYDGSSLGKSTSLMEHLPTKFLLNISFLLLPLI